MSVFKSVTIFAAALLAAGLAGNAPASAAPSVNTGVVVDSGRDVEPQLAYHGDRHPAKIVRHRGYVKRIIVTPAPRLVVTPRVVVKKRIIVAPTHRHVVKRIVVKRPYLYGGQRYYH